MRKTLILFAVALGIGTSGAAVADVPATAAPKPAAAATYKGPAPCQQIVAACKSAGFVFGDYKKGFGLWVDCVDPIVHGGGQPSNAVKALPTVPPATVAACKTKDPNFPKHNKSTPQ